MPSNAMSVVPNIVAIDGLSPATNEHSLFHLAEKIGPVQVAFLVTAALIPVCFLALS